MMMAVAVAAAIAASATGGAAVPAATALGRSAEIRTAELVTADDRAVEIVTADDRAVEIVTADDRAMQFHTVSDRAAHPLTVPDQTAHPLTAADRAVLVRYLATEAADEPLLIQAALAAVVLNRMNSDDFPDSARAVLRADGRFAADSSWLTVIPGGNARLTATVALEAALAADPTDGSLDFTRDDGSPLSFVPRLRAAGWSFGVCPR